ncbi:MAG: dihydrodipicolinate synthase family protein [Armatimonadetes bacterium]|nr:dihydrodipicolinate synthase family protein [Armatimonadota bacterium]
MTVDIPDLERNPLWSATPTPLTEQMEIDVGSVHRLVEHHIKLGITGLFLLGTCGEGPWMPDRLRWELVRQTASYNDGRLTIAAQVTDNSTARIVQNIEMATEAGADIAVIAPPYLPHLPTPATLEKLYLQAIEQSPLPVGIYERGERAATVVPRATMESIIAHEKVIIVKDSSLDEGRRDAWLAVRRRRQNLRLLSGYEFDCVSYLQAGYDGLLLGGGIFNGYTARQLMEAVAAGDFAQARQLQDRMNEMMWAVYGGKDLTCWMSGIKHLLVKMGIFSTANRFLDYPLTDECRRNIAHALQQYRDILFPWEGN